MAVRTEWHGERHIKRVKKNVDDFLVLAADHLTETLKTPGITPVITGNLVGSTYRGHPRNQSIRIGQTAEYAIYVEARKFHFSYAIQYAIPGIRRLLKLIKID